MSFSSFLGKTFLAQAEYVETKYDQLPIPKSFLAKRDESTESKDVTPSGSSSSVAEESSSSVPSVVSVLPLPAETSKGRTGLGVGVRGYTSIVSRVVDNFVNVDPDADGIRKVEEQQKAERLAELREAASIASVRSKFPQPKISSSSSSSTSSSSTKKKSGAASSSSNTSSNTSDGSINGVDGANPSSPSSSSLLLKKDKADDETQVDSRDSTSFQSIQSNNKDAGLAMAESKEETTNDADKTIGIAAATTSFDVSTAAADAADAAHAELRLLLETINESPAVRAILLARSPELAELIDGTNGAGNVNQQNIGTDKSSADNGSTGSSANSSLSSSASAARAAALKFLAENKNSETVSTLFQQKTSQEGIVSEISPLKASTSSSSGEGEDELTSSNVADSAHAAQSTKDDATAEEVLARLDAVLSKAISSIGDKYHELRSPTSSSSSSSSSSRAAGNVEAVSPPSNLSSSSSAIDAINTDASENDTQNQVKHQQQKSTSSSIPATPNPLLPSRIPIYIGRLSSSQPQSLHSSHHFDTENENDGLMNNVSESLRKSMYHDNTTNDDAYSSHHQDDTTSAFENDIRLPEVDEEARPVPASTVSVLRSRENAISEAQRLFRMSQILGEPTVAPSSSSSSSSSSFSSSTSSSSSSFIGSTSGFSKNMFTHNDDSASTAVKAVEEAETHNGSIRSRASSLRTLQEIAGDAYDSSAASSGTTLDISSSSSSYPPSLSPRVEDLAARLRAAEAEEEYEKKTEEKLGGVSASVERRYAMWKGQAQLNANNSSSSLTSSSTSTSISSRKTGDDKTKSLSSTSTSSSSLASEIREIQSLLKAAKDINFKALMPPTSETAAVAIAKSRAAQETGTSSKSQRDYPVLPPQPDYSGPEILSPAMKSLLGRARAVLVNDEEEVDEVGKKANEERKLEFTIKGGSAFAEPPLSSISVFSDPVRSFSPTPPPFSSLNNEYQANTTNGAVVIPSYTLSAARMQPINALADRALAAAAEATSSSSSVKMSLSSSSSSPRNVIRQNAMNIPPPVLLSSPMPSIDSREAAERPHLVFSTSLPSSSSSFSSSTSSSSSSSFSGSPSSSSPPPQPQLLNSLPPPSSAFATSAHALGASSSSSYPHRVLSVHLPASTPQQPPAFGAERPFRPSRSTNASSSSPQNASFSNASVVIDGGASASANIIAARASAVASSAASMPFFEPTNSFSSSATPGRFSSALQDILSPLRR